MQGCTSAMSRDPAAARPWRRTCCNRIHRPAPGDPTRQEHRWPSRCATSHARPASRPRPPRARSSAPDLVAPARREPVRRVAARARLPAQPRRPRAHHRPHRQPVPRRAGPREPVLRRRRQGRPGARPRRSGSPSSSPTPRRTPASRPSSSPSSARRWTGSCCARRACRRRDARGVARRRPARCCWSTASAPGCRRSSSTTRDGVRQAVAHLYALGHRRVAYAGGPAGSWSDARRRDGPRAARRPRRRGRRPRCVRPGVRAAASPPRTSSLAAGVTAVLAHNDLVALGVLDRLTRPRRPRARTTCRVVGFDDSRASRPSSPALTTVGPSPAGRRASGATTARCGLLPRRRGRRGGRPRARAAARRARRARLAPAAAARRSRRRRPHERAPAVRRRRWAGACARACPDGGPAARRSTRPTLRGSGIVHLGLGAFHRAHQAVLHRGRRRRDRRAPRWGILGVTQRSARVVEQLAPQDGLYGVLTKGTAETSLRVVGTMRDVAFPGPTPAGCSTRSPRRRTHVVTLTVTEKGYRRAPGGGPDLADPTSRRTSPRSRAARRGRLPPPGRRRDARARARAAAPRRRRAADRRLLRQPRGQRGGPGAARRGRCAPCRAATRCARGSGERCGSPRRWSTGSCPRRPTAHRAEAAAAARPARRGPRGRRAVLQWVVEDAFAGAAARLGGRRRAPHRRRRPLRAGQARDPQRDPLHAGLPRCAARVRDDRPGRRRPGPRG